MFGGAGETLRLQRGAQHSRKSDPGERHSIAHDLRRAIGVRHRQWNDRLGGGATGKARQTAIGIVPGNLVRLRLPACKASRLKLAELRATGRHQCARKALLRPAVQRPLDEVSIPSRMQRLRPTVPAYTDRLLIATAVAIVGRMQWLMDITDDVHHDPQRLQPLAAGRRAIPKTGQRALVSAGRTVTVSAIACATGIGTAHGLIIVVPALRTRMLVHHPAALLIQPQTHVRQALITDERTNLITGAGVESLFRNETDQPMALWPPRMRRQRNGERHPQPHDRPTTCNAPPAANARHQTYHWPVFGIDAHGSADAFAAPFCNSSMEMLSGDLTKAMRPSRGGRLMVTPAFIKRSQMA